VLTTYHLTGFSEGTAAREDGCHRQRQPVSIHAHAQPNLRVAVQSPDDGVQAFYGYSIVFIYWECLLGLIFQRNRLSFSVKFGNATKGRVHFYRVHLSNAIAVKQTGNCAPKHTDCTPRNVKHQKMLRVSACPKSVRNRKRIQ